MSRVALTRCLLGLLAVDVALGLWLARPRKAVVVPGAPASAVLTPQEPTEAALRQFAVYFAVNLDNFTPKTFEPQAWVVLDLLAPGARDMESLIAERARMVEGAGLGSSLFVDPSTIQVSGHTVMFRGWRRQYIGEKLSWKAPFRYTIGIETAPPTETNPYGLAVRSHRAVRLKDEEMD